MSQTGLGKVSTGTREVRRTNWFGLHERGKDVTKDIPHRPKCITCHATSKTEKSKQSHTQHKDKVSCYACHTASLYRNCYDCHLGKGAQAKPALILGRNPRDPNMLTTLRAVPTIKDTFKGAGIAQEKFGEMANYWDTTPHNIAKRTDRTRACSVCHTDQKYFLKNENMLPGNQDANEKLIKLPPKQNK